MAERRRPPSLVDADVVRAAVLASRHADRRAWGRICVLVGEGKVEVCQRSYAAAKLRHTRAELAHEVLQRGVPEGAVLVLRAERGEPVLEALALEGSKP